MFIRKTYIGPSIVYVGLTLGLMAVPVMAVPTVSPDFFATQNAAEEFFEVGRRRLEREVKLLKQRQSQHSPQILQVDEQTKLNQKELENGDGLHPQYQLHKRKMN